MLAKRPIFNQQLKCVAFEILSPQDIPLNEELVDILLNVVNASESKLPLFIPFALKTLLEQFAPPLENPIILLINAEEIDSKYPLNDLNESLFSIALVINHPKQLAWLNFAEYIGLTEHLMSQADVSKVVKYSKETQRRIIGYGLGTPVNFEKCKVMTMDYYCGNFLYKPFHINDDEIAGNKLNLLNLIQKLQHDDCDLDEISSIIKTDALLSYQLLRIANTVAYSSSHGVDSIEQAIARLGLIHLKNWVMIFSMKNISDKPTEILESALIRAFMCQELAKGIDEEKTQMAYTLGLLSILDSLLNKPMDQILDKINLATEITDALLAQKGPFGSILSVVIAYEGGDWLNVPQRVFNGLNLNEVYLEALDFVAKGASAIHS